MSYILYTVLGLLYSDAVAWAQDANRVPYVKCYMLPGRMRGETPLGEQKVSSLMLFWKKPYKSQPFENCSWCTLKISFVNNAKCKHFINCTKPALHTPTCITASARRSIGLFCRSLFLKQSVGCNTRCFITHYIFNHNTSQSNIHCLNNHKITYQEFRIIRCTLRSKKDVETTSVCLSVCDVSVITRFVDIHEIRYSSSSQKVVKPPWVGRESAQ